VKAGKKLHSENFRAALKMLKKADLRGLESTIACNADIAKALDTSGLSILVHAIQLKNRDAVRLLLEHGSMVNYQNPLFSSPLKHASLSSNIQIVQLIVESNADLNHQDLNGWTAVAWLCSPDCGSLECLQYLVERGADIHLPINSGYTPLMIASKAGFTSIVEYLLIHGANPNTQAHCDGATALLCSSDIKVTKLLLEAGADPNIFSHHGDNSLTMFVELKSMQGVRLLIRYGADPSLDGRALIVACSSGLLDMALFLIQSGSIDVKTPGDYCSPIESFGSSATPNMSLKNRQKGFQILSQAYGGVGGTLTFNPGSSAPTDMIELEHDYFNEMKTESLRMLMTCVKLPLDPNKHYKKNEMREMLLNTGKIRLTNYSTAPAESLPARSMRPFVVIDQHSFLNQTYSELFRMATHLEMSLPSSVMMGGDDEGNNTDSNKTSLLRDLMLKSGQVRVHNDPDILEGCARRAARKEAMRGVKA
jgi:ankyrin repeat protein